MQKEKLVKGRDLRATLRQIVEKELDSLPETLADLEPQKRLELIVKLLPYTVPRVDKVASSTWEPFDAFN